MTTGAKARRSQLLSTYGIGGLFPSESTSFMITGLDDWNESRAPIVSEPRLARWGYARTGGGRSFAVMMLEVIKIL